jgi:hypothetical protein
MPLSIVPKWADLVSRTNYSGELDVHSVYTLFRNLSAYHGEGGGVELQKPIEKT